MPGVLRDTKVYEYYPNDSYENALDLAVSSRSGYRYYSFISFTSDCYFIDSIQLYCKSAVTGGYINVHKVVSEWPTYVTWYNQPSVGDLISSIPSITVNAWNTIPIKKYVTEIPYGIRLSSNGWDIYFHSKETGPSGPIVNYSYKDLAFIDVSSSMIITADKQPYGGIPLDFAQIVAGNVSNVKAVDFYNHSGFTVQNPIIWLEDIPLGDTVEISRYNNPFVPSQQIIFDGTFTSPTKIGTFYIRVKPGEDSSGSKSFRIKAKATPV